MKQEVFEKQHSELWQELENTLAKLSGRNRNNPSARKLPDLYRKICHHYSLAKERHYSPALIERLHTLMLQTYQIIYKPRYSILSVLGELLLKKFPQSLQRNWKLFLIAFGLLYVPMFGMGIATYINPELIYLVMDPMTVSNLEYMYNPDNDIIGRDADNATASRVMMFGHYIQNNTSIDLRVFAGGISFGFFTILILLFNGVYIGAAAGYLTKLGYNETFWSFVPGHSGFELNSVVISALAGLLLTKALILPGRYTRADALKLAGKEAATVIFGAAIMMIIAAAIEAFWSPTQAFPLSVKIAVGLSTWVLLYWYFFFVGRQSNQQPSSSGAY